MGLFDFLKKPLATGAEPLLSMEPQCLRYEWFTMHLPAGWQFTQADNRSFALSGPGGCAAEVKFTVLRGFAMSAFEKHRESVTQIMRSALASATVNERKLMSGVLWMEAMDVYAGTHRVKIALFNSRPRKREEYPPPLLVVTCTMPSTAEGAVAAAAQTAALCEALQGIAWN